jgi:hypothetical protein
MELPGSWMLIGWLTPSGSWRAPLEFSFGERSEERLETSVSARPWLDQAFTITGARGATWTVVFPA